MLAMSHISISDLQPTSIDTAAESSKIIQISEGEVKKMFGGIDSKPFVIHTDRWVVTFCPDGTISHGSTSFCPRRFGVFSN